MKRILLVSPFPPSLGGVSVSVQRLYDFLVQSGYHVVKFDTQFVNRKYNRLKWLKLFKYMSLPFFLMANSRFDVVHFHVSNVLPKLYVSLWRAFFSSRTTFIITLHGEVNHILKSRLGKFSLSRFDKIICVKSGDLHNMPVGLKEKTVEIPAFIPPLVSNGSHLAPGSLKFNERNSFKILVSGFVIINEKFNDLYGFADAIRLLEQLRKSGKNAELVLIVLGHNNGKESDGYIKKLKDECLMRGLDKYVCWIEGINMELWPVLKKVHVLLRPTKSDGDALSIREALFLKVPVITSSVVPRPSDTIVYDMHSENDLFKKTISLMDNYEVYVSKIGNHDISFAEQIIEQYEH